MVGIDPGTVNLGVAILGIPTIKGDVYQAQLYQVKFAKRAIDVMGRLKAVQELLEKVSFLETKLNKLKLRSA